MRSYSANGIVLHRNLIGESDRIITIFSGEHGKFRAVAKGSRKPGSRLSGATELFSESQFLISRGKSLDIVSQCEIRRSFPALRNNLDLLARATYLCELLDHMTVDHDATASESILGLTRDALEILQHADIYPDAALHMYEIHLLAILGYAPNIDCCTHCGDALEEKSGVFSAAYGGILCPRDRSRAQDACVLSFEAMDIMRRLRDSDIEVILTLAPSRRVAAEVARALRSYIDHRIERRLKSVDFLNQVRQYHESPSEMTSG